MTDFALSENATVRDAVQAIEASPKRIAVVADGEGRVAGTLTDGDIRRALLAGHRLESPVTRAMNRHPLTVPVATSEPYLIELLETRNLEALPLVDEQDRFVRLVHIAELSPEAARGGADGFAAAVIMAGGEGRRLRPLTADLPKPMVDLGGMPLIERQVRTLVKAGVTRLYISVNYLSHVIQDHFGDGDDFGASIRYLEEKSKMGTAGALSLLPERSNAPLLVINGDVFTASDYGNLYVFHETHGASVTVAAVDYHVEIPYGVVRSDGTRALAVEEKPSQRFLCNAGIYVLSPGALALVPQNAFFDMTDLIEDAIEQEHFVSVFPIHEYWTDIGTHADLDKAREAVRAMEGECV